MKAHLIASASVATAIARTAGELIARPWSPGLACPSSNSSLSLAKISSKKYESHPGVYWGFCSQCGTSFLGQYDKAPEKIYVTVASLEGPLDRQPDSHVSFEEHVDWFHFSDKLPRFRAKTQEQID